MNYLIGRLSVNELRFILLGILYIGIFGMFIESIIIFRRWKNMLQGYLILNCIATLVNIIGYLMELNSKTKGEYTQICTIPKNTLNWGNFSITLLAFHDNAENLCNARDVICFPVSAQRIKIGNWMGGREPGDVTPKFPFSEKQTG